MFKMVSFTFWICTCVLSHVRLFVSPWSVACQASLSMGFPRQECWSGLPFPSSGGLPNPGIEPVSLVSPALTRRFFTISSTCYFTTIKNLNTFSMENKWCCQSLSEMLTFLTESSTYFFSHHPRKNEDWACFTGRSHSTSLCKAPQKL